MLQAAALFFGSLATWLLIEQQFGAGGLIAASVSSLTCVFVTARMPKLGWKTFTRMPRLAVLQAVRLGRAVAAGFAVVRSALAADVKLQPALVRVRTRLTDTLSLAAFASMIGISAGAVVIGIDDDGLLVHVNQENDNQFADIRHWEEELAAERGEAVAS